VAGRLRFDVSFGSSWLRGFLAVSVVLFRRPPRFFSSSSGLLPALTRTCFFFIVVIVDTCHPTSSYPFVPHSPCYQPLPYPLILTLFSSPCLPLARFILPQRDDSPCDMHPLVDVILMLVEHRASPLEISLPIPMPSRPDRLYSARTRCHTRSSSRFASIAWVRKGRAREAVVGRLVGVEYWPEGSVSEMQAVRWPTVSHIRSDHLARYLMSVKVCTRSCGPVTCQLVPDDLWPPEIASAPSTTVLRSDQTTSLIVPLVFRSPCQPSQVHWML